MKFFVTFALLFVLAAARVLPPAVIASQDPEIQEIVAAIQSPSTDPATAAALEQMLLQILGISQPEPIEVGPAVIDFPVPDGGAVTAQPSPVVTSPAPPLVQIIINTKPNVPSSPVVVETVKPPAPTPVQVVEAPAVPEPVIVVDKPIVAPIVIPDPITPPEPIETPEDPEPVIVVEPIIVAPVIIPDPLN